MVLVITGPDQAAHLVGMMSGPFGPRFMSPRISGIRVADLLHTIIDRSRFVIGRRCGGGHCRGKDHTQANSQSLRHPGFFPSSVGGHPASRRPLLTSRTDPGAGSAQSHIIRYRSPAAQTTGVRPSRRCCGTLVVSAAISRKGAATALPTAADAVAGIRSAARGPTFGGPAIGGRDQLPGSSAISRWRIASNSCWRSAPDSG